MADQAALTITFFIKNIEFFQNYSNKKREFIYKLIYFGLKTTLALEFPVALQRILPMMQVYSVNMQKYI